MHSPASKAAPGPRVLTQSLSAAPMPTPRTEHETMTSLRWDNVPNLALSGRRCWRPARIQRAGSRSCRASRTVLRRGRARIGLHDLAGSARTASAKRGSGRCSSCKARGVTLWRFSGRLVCAKCRGEMWAEYHRSSRQAPASTQRTSPGPGKRTGPSRSSALSEERLARLRDLQRKLNPPEAITEAWR